MKDFFRNSWLLDELALRQLSHINGNWELTWSDSDDLYEPEDDSFASKVNDLIEELGSLTPPTQYHDNEDRLAEQVQGRPGWDLCKVGTRWIGGDYPIILEQGSFNDNAQHNLMLAAAGRIKAAIDRGQMHFDEMEKSHQKILADVLAIILYHRTNA
ncbi:hypothetical protein E4695_15105 [Alcaligenaceae bacterium 429]|nr:hypothetical protein E4695_15105 [Alcaligenaceae bacterium 429]